MATALEAKVSEAKVEVGHHHNHDHDHSKSITVIDNVGTSIPAILHEKSEMKTLIEDLRAKIANTAPALALVINDSCLPCFDSCGHDNMVSITNKASGKNQAAKFIAPEVMSTQITNIVASDHYAALDEELKLEYGPIFIQIKAHLDNIARFQASVAEMCACCCADNGGAVGAGTAVSGISRVREGADEKTYDAAIDALEKCGACPHKSGCIALLEALYDVAYQKRISK